MVTILDRLRQLVKPPEPAPKAVATAGPARTYFSKQDRTTAILERYQTIYDQGGPVAEAVDCYPLTILSNGYRLEGDENLAKTVQATLDSFGFDTVLWSAIVDALVLGDSFDEAVHAKLGGRFLRVELRDSTRFRVRQNPQTGAVEGYTFLPPGEWDETRTVPLDPADIFHLRLMPRGNSPYGKSLIQRAYDDILRDVKTAEGTSAAIERHGFPRHHVAVGQPGEAVPQEDLDAIGKKWETLTAKMEFVTDGDTKIQTIDAGGIPNVDIFSNVTLTRLCAAMGVPEEMLGLGRGSTEATATVRLKAWHDKCAALQQRIAPEVTRQIIDQIAGRPGAVWLVFNDPNPSDDALVANLVTTQIAALAAVGVRPKAEWVAGKFGIDVGTLEAIPEPADTYAPGIIDGAGRANARSLAKTPAANLGRVRAVKSRAAVRDKAEGEIEAAVEKARRRILAAVAPLDGGES